MRLAWGPQFVLGIDFVDRQHKKLIEYIQDLEKVIKDHKKDDRRMFEILNNLVDYANSHFTQEQEMLKKISYSGYDEHVLEHKKFFDKISELESKVKASEPFFETILLAFLEQWLFGHISNDDRAYLNFIKNHSIDPSVL